MHKFILNGENMCTREAAHGEIARELQFPEYYGKNLDALWDLITTMRADVVLLNPAPMLNALGAYGCTMLKTLFEAAEENPGFSFSIRA